jgi:NAD(P)-dependent dehydrogenase (short-subunit alcohol dehydrogenase family)
MDLKLAGKVVLITGSSRGIGLAAATAPVAHRLAAVAVPCTDAPCFKIAPAPMNPTPVVSPSITRA